MSSYLTTHDVEVMHHVLIERYGGALGLRDANLLEAAVFRPQSGYYADSFYKERHHLRV
jgi:death-on-curing protein